MPVLKEATAGSTPLLERFSRLLLPMPFFSGVVLGLLLCIAGGHLAARANIYSDRSRFFFQISPEGYVYPTLENLLQFVRQKAPPAKILVLAAGSSISLGVGQQDKHLWTDLLQRELGDEFAVVNVSFRSAKFTSLGLPLLEILSQEYSHFLFVTESRPGYAPEWMVYDSRSSFFYPYNYLLFQAWLSGKLLPNPERDQELWDAYPPLMSILSSMRVKISSARCWNGRPTRAISGIFSVTASFSPCFPHYNRPLAFLGSPQATG